MKNQIFIFFILLITSCTTLKLKPQPTNGKYEKCPNCKGYGVIESIVSPGEFFSVSKKVDKEKGEIAGGIISGSIKASHPDKVYDITEGKGNSAEKQHVYNEDAAYNVSNKSYLKKKIACPRCKGAGWIKLKVPQLVPKRIFFCWISISKTTPHSS